MQIVDDKNPVLHWLLPAGDELVRTYELVSGKSDNKAMELNQKPSDGVLTVTANGKKLLAYQFGNADSDACQEKINPGGAGGKC